MITNQNSFSVKLHHNNFDFLRVVFAITVFLVHAAVLSGNSFLISLTKFLSSEVAVKSFFVVSGFLIFMSYENSRSISSYFSKRIRRIYPAYLFLICLSVLVGSFFTASSSSEYWSLATFRYFASNLFFLNFLQPELPGLFLHNPNTAVNGALWTLKVEVMFYLAVPLVAFCCMRWNKMLVLLGLFLLSIIYSEILFYFYSLKENGYLLELQRQLPGQLTFFLIGASGYYYFDYFKKYSLSLLALAFVGYVFKAYIPWLVFEPIAIGILVIYFALVFPYFGNFGKYGDFSYGIYILHFPILQFFISSHLFENNPLTFITVVAMTVLLFSVLLWHLIEKPFLKRGSHYVAK